MPKQTVYIRDSDMEAWKATANKSEMISKALRGEQHGTPAAKQPVKKSEKRPTLQTLSVASGLGRCDICGQYVCEHKAL